MTGKAFVGAAAAAVIVATGALAASSLSGTYTEKIAGATPALLNGTWTVALKPGAYTIKRNGAVAVVGKLAAVTKTRLRFTDTGGPLSCTGAQAKGVYSYVLKGTSLTLKPVAETCAGRKLVLTAHPLKRAG
jgi:hypothetical protein